MKKSHESFYRGEATMKAISTARVVVCGIGAIGSNLVDQLARMGFGNLAVIDYDRVTAENVVLQRYGESDVGSKKVKALADIIFRDTGVEIEAIDKKLDHGNATKFLKDADLVVDAFDNSVSRSILQAWSLMQFASGSGSRTIHAGLWEGYGEVVCGSEYRVPSDDPNAVDVCDKPLARNLVMLVVAILAEEVVRALTGEPSRSWSVTLNDLAIRPYR